MNENLYIAHNKLPHKTLRVNKLPHKTLRVHSKILNILSCHLHLSCFSSDLTCFLLRYESCSAENHPYCSNMSTFSLGM